MITIKNLLRKLLKARQLEAVSVDYVYFKYERVILVTEVQIYIRLCWKYNKIMHDICDKGDGGNT